jgi:hypothetical protein
MKIKNFNFKLINKSINAFQIAAYYDKMATEYDRFFSESAKLRVQCASALIVSTDPQVLERYMDRLITVLIAMRRIVLHRLQVLNDDEAHNLKVNGLTM